MTRYLRIPIPDWTCEGLRETPIDPSGPPYTVCRFRGQHYDFPIRVPTAWMALAGPEFDFFHLGKRLEVAYHRTIEQFIHEMGEKATGAETDE